MKSKTKVNTYYQALIYDKKTNKLLNSYTAFSDRKLARFLYNDKKLKKCLKKIKSSKHTFMYPEDIIKVIEDYRIEVNEIIKGYHSKKDKVVTIMK